MRSSDHSDPSRKLEWSVIPGVDTSVSNRLMGMCRWIGSHFHGWIDYNGVAFSFELLEWDNIFSGFGTLENSGSYGFKNEKIFISLSLTNVSILYSSFQGAFGKRLNK